ncbi:MAG: glycosyltransferase family 39 protein [Thermoanaerobaculia bacterium]|nr:glycosyltransferase family 39 protein [Thermoanaerobaculia bacterium]
MTDSEEGKSTVCGTRRGRIALLSLVVLLLALQVLAIDGQSLTGDGAYHLLAGYQALRYGQNRINLEHPPLVKLLVALPALAEDRELADPVDATEALEAAERIHRQPDLLRRATLGGRVVLLVTVVLPLFLTCYLLGSRFGGPCVGLLLVPLFGLSFSVVPLLTILQTDAALTLGVCLTVLALWRWQRRPKLGRALAVGASFGVALGSKFSGVLLAPAVAITFLLPVPPLSWRRRLRDLGIALLVACAFVHALYSIANWSYDRNVGRDTIRSYVRGRGSLIVGELLEPWEEELLALEEVSPTLAQWTVGFLGVRAQNRIGVYPSYAFGTVSSQGRWWYFPALFLVKTPLALLIALAATLPILGRMNRSLDWRRILPPVLFVTAYLIAAVGSNYNLGFRHLLPVLPFLLLPVAMAARGWRRGTWVLLGVLALESVLLTPRWMSATNTWWLGERNPTRLAFSAGNLEYRQSFVQLARWSRGRRIEGLRVLYPALDEVVLTAYLPDAELVEPGDPVTPGWYAVSTTVEQYVPAILTASPDTLYGYRGLRGLARRWLPLWQEVARRGTDQGYVAGTFHIYRIEPPPASQSPPESRPSDP